MELLNWLVENWVVVILAAFAFIGAFCTVVLFAAAIVAGRSNNV